MNTQKKVLSNFKLKNYLVKHYNRRLDWKLTAWSISGWFWIGFRQQYLDTACLTPVLTGGCRSLIQRQLDRKEFKFTYESWSSCHLPCGELVLIYYT